jgi:excisionase family DNA binding protein
VDDIVEEIVRDLPPLITIDAAATLLGKSERTVRSYIARGLLRAIRPCGGAPRLPLSELRRILHEGAS